MDIFDTKTILPMTISRSETIFDSKDYIYELKLDGLRTLAYLSESKTDLRNRQNISLLPKFPELSGLHLKASEKCILDGELIVLRHGIPDFFSLQDRLFDEDFSFTDSDTNYIKQKPHYISAPASYVAYDILYYKDHFVTDLPLIERKQLLEEVIHEALDISISRYVESRGTELMRLALSEQLEGVVAKKRDSQYFIGQNSPDWIKFQQSHVVHYVLCGAMIGDNGVEYFILGQYKEDRLIYRGYINLMSFKKISIPAASLSGKNSILPERIFDLPYYYDHYPIKEIDQSPFDLQPVFDSCYLITWFEPNFICSIEYSSAKKSTLQSGFIKGIRNDIAPKECTFR